MIQNKFVTLSVQLRLQGYGKKNHYHCMDITHVQEENTKQKQM